MKDAKRFEDNPVFTNLMKRIESLEMTEKELLKVLREMKVKIGIKTVNKASGDLIEHADLVILKGDK